MERFVKEQNENETILLKVFVLERNGTISKKSERAQPYAWIQYPSHFNMETMNDGSLLIILLQFLYDCKKWRRKKIHNQQSWQQTLQNIKNPKKKLMNTMLTLFQIESWKRFSSNARNFLQVLVNVTCNLYINLAYLSVCPFVSNKRQYYWTDRAQILCGI